MDFRQVGFRRVKLVPPIIIRWGPLSQGFGRGWGEGSTPRVASSMAGVGWIGVRMALTLTPRPTKARLRRVIGTTVTPSNPPAFAEAKPRLRAGGQAGEGALPMPLPKSAPRGSNE